MNYDCITASKLSSMVLQENIATAILMALNLKSGFNYAYTNR